MADSVIKINKKDNIFTPGKFLKCSECPRFKDTAPDKVDYHGNHFGICGMGGNKVYPNARKEKRYNGKGWIHFSESSCGLYKTFDEAFEKMTESEKKRWKESHRLLG